MNGKSHIEVKTKALEIGNKKALLQEDKMNRSNTRNSNLTRMVAER